jgi:hypothetical protein
LKENSLEGVLAVEVITTSHRPEVVNQEAPADEDVEGLAAVGEAARVIAVEVGGVGGASQRILYGGRWWLPPSPGRGVFRGPKCPWLVPTPKGVPECELTTWVVCFDADSSLIY